MIKSSFSKINLTMRFEVIENKNCAVYSGTFDPITIGHLDIIQRGSKIFDKLVIAVAESNEKNTMFSLDKRIEMIKNSTQNLQNIEIKPFKILLVDFLKQEKINIIIRGLRNTIDFEYEKSMDLANKSLDNNIETIFFNSKPEMEFISSSVVRTILNYNGDISHLVPKENLQFIIKGKK